MTASCPNFILLFSELFAELEPLEESVTYGMS